MSAGTVTATFSGNITGNVTGAVTANGTGGQLVTLDDRIIEPSAMSAGRLQFGFTSWANNNTSPYADYLHLRSYTDSSGGNDNLVMFRKDTLGMRIYQQSFGSTSAYSSVADVLLSTNYGSYSTFTGTVQGTTFTSTVATGTAPLSVTSTTTVTNLRANYVTFGMLDNNNDSMNFRIIRNNNSVSNRDGMYIGYGNANSGDTRLYGGGDTANPVTIGTGGNLTASGTVTANSDIKLKKNIKTIENALDKVLNLRGVEFDRIDSNEHQIGVIAQEIEKIIPEVVHYSKETDTKSVAYGNITAVLIEAIKEQQQTINSLRTEIEELKIKLNG